MTLDSTLDLITALWLGFIGACIGSFLNVVAYRMPLGMSVIWKPSHCPKCDHPIRAYDNVPVLGWLWLKGKCRDCGEPISPRYAIVEFVMGLAFFVLAYVELFTGGANLPGGPITEFTGAVQNVWDPQWQLIGVYAYHVLLLSLLMVLLLCNRDSKILPKSLLWLGAISAIVFSSVIPTTQGLRILTGNGYAGRLAGVLLGSLCGSVAGRIAYRAKFSCGTGPAINLQLGGVLLGLFFGGWAILPLTALVLATWTICAVNRKPCTPLPVDAVFPIALLHVILVGAIFRFYFP